jgi:hypothetical protein
MISSHVAPRTIRRGTVETGYRHRQIHGREVSRPITQAALADMEDHPLCGLLWRSYTHAIMEHHLVGELDEWLSARNTARNDTNKTTAQRRKPFRIRHSHAKSTVMSTADT